MSRWPITENIGGFICSSAVQHEPVCHRLISTTAVLSLKDGRLPRNLVLADAVQSTRDISRDTTQQWIVQLENGKSIRRTRCAVEFHQLAQKHFGDSSAETNWLWKLGLRP
jgi:hypothetical protein